MKEGVSSAFKGVYVIPLYGADGNNILPVSLLPLKELLETGEYLFKYIDPDYNGDEIRYKLLQISTLSRFNPDDEEDEFWFTGLKLEIFNVQP